MDRRYVKRIGDFFFLRIKERIYMYNIKNISFEITIQKSDYVINIYDSDDIISTLELTKEGYIEFLKIFNVEKFEDFTN